jgi:hypothetical protein
MAEERRVEVRIDKWLEGEQARLGVPVRFRPVVEDPKTKVRRIDRQRQIKTVIAPVTRTAYGSPVSLVPGDYDVEAVLPSGEPLGEELKVPAAHQANEDTIEVVLRGDYSPNEWRSWGHFTGSPLTSLRQVDRERRLEVNPNFQPSKLEVSIGQMAMSELSGSFNPARWDDWFTFLEARRHNSEEAPEIRLEENDFGLAWKTEGGFGAEPIVIRFTQQRPPTASLEPEAIGKDRIYAAIRGKSGTRLIGLPWPWGWPSSDQIPFEILALEDRETLRCDPILRDPEWAGLVAYLNKGRLDLASEILKAAQVALYGKFQNPLAAAAGGYVLLSYGATGEEEEWPSWLGNLNHYFPHFPDGAVLRARWLLGQNTEEGLLEAHQLLYEAVDRGIPYFTTGIVWLMEGLEQTSIDCQECAERLRRVRGVARWIDLGQAFTSFGVGRPLTRHAKETPFHRESLPGVTLDVPETLTEEEAMRYNEALLDQRIKQRKLEKKTKAKAAVLRLTR